MVLEPLYRRVLGPDFDRLPAEIRELHDVRGESLARGRCRIRRGGHPLARLTGWLFRMPPAGEDLPVEVAFRPQRGGELWRRSFAGNPLASFQEAAGRPGWIFESFGPGRFLLEVPVDDAGLALLLRGVRILGLPLPRALWPRIRAGESVAAGRFVFDVEIRLPLAGLLVHYRGYLEPARREA